MLIVSLNENRERKQRWLWPCSMCLNLNVVSSDTSRMLYEYANVHFSSSVINYDCLCVQFITSVYFCPFLLVFHFCNMRACVLDALVFRYIKWKYETHWLHRAHNKCNLFRCIESSIYTSTSNIKHIIDAEYSFLLSIRTGKLANIQ